MNATNSASFDLTAAAHGQILSTRSIRDYCERVWKLRPPSLAGQRPDDFIGSSMLSKLFIAWCLMALCVTIHAIGLTAAFRWMKRRPTTIEGRFWPTTWTLICIAGWTILMHLVQIAVWAFLYAWKHGMPDLASAFYFSAVTYTTTGYGDLVLPKEWRLVGAVEALTGILMCGLSTGLFFAVFSKVFGLNRASAPAA